MSYDVWDTSSGNLIRTYATESEALGFVRAAVERHGRRFVSRWALLAVEGDGEDEDEQRVVAQGAALATRAANAVPA